MEQSPTPSPRPVNKLAVAASACTMSIVGALCFFVIITIFVPYALWSAGAVCGGSGMLAGMAGVILGLLALKQIKATPSQKGKGLAIAAIVIGALYLLLFGFILISYLQGPVIGPI